MPKRDDLTRITVTVSPELKTSLQLLAHARSLESGKDVRLSDLVREALESYAARGPSQRLLRRVAEDQERYRV